MTNRGDRTDVKAGTASRRKHRNQRCPVKKLAGEQC
jgi:hypothetical protein